jgi:2'-5' RNA ligase
MGMGVIRAFIAIDIPDAIQQKLNEITTRLQSLDQTKAVRWVAARNIHLTLKFLGEVSQTNLELLTEIIQAEAIKHRPFELEVGELGAFPSIRRPRVIWIGIHAPQELLTLQHGVEAETIRLGYAAEERPFSPHLTLARISHNASPEDVRCIGEILATQKVGILGKVNVTRVVLFRSDLRPGGAIYTPLFNAPLVKSVK